MADLNVEDLNNKFRELTETIGGVTRGSNNLVSAQSAAAKQMAAFNTAIKTASTATGTNLVNFGKQLGTTTAGMAKYSSAITNVTSTLGSVIGKFGVMGKLAGGLISVFGRAVETVLKQNDTLLSATDELAQIGISSDLTTKQLKELANNALYTTHNLTDYTKIIRRLGVDTTAFGTTMSRGYKEFNKLLETTPQQVASFGVLGVTQQQLNETQVDYIKMLLRTGVSISAQDKASGQLKKTTLEYMTNLMDLSALTGNDVEEIKKRQMAARQELEFATRMSQLQQQEEDARKRGLTEEAESLKIERERRTALVNTFAAMELGPKMTSELINFVAAGNFNSFNSALATGIPGIQEFVAEVVKSGRAPEEFAFVMRDAVEYQKRNFAESVIQNKENANSIGLTTETLAFAARMNSAVAKGEEKQFMENLKRDREARASEMDQYKKSADIAKEARRQQQITEMLTRVGLDKFVELIRGPITAAFEMVQRMLNQFAKQLAYFVRWLGGPDFTKMFESPGEIAEELDKTKKELKGITDDIEKTRTRATQARAATPESISALRSSLETKAGESSTKINEIDLKLRQNAADRRKALATNEMRKVQMLDDSTAALREQRKLAVEQHDTATDDLRNLDDVNSAKKLAERLEKEVQDLEKERLAAEKKLNEQRLRQAEARQRAGQALTTDELKLIEEQRKQALNFRTKSLADLIGQHEGGTGGYNAINMEGGRKVGTRDLANMTVGQLMQSQKKGEIHAAGRYQMIHPALIDAIKAGVVQEDEQFTPEVQDRIFRDFLLGKKRPAVQAFLMGQNQDVNAAVLSLAQEFASIGVPHDIKDGNRNIKRGQSYYAGIGANPTGDAPISPDTIRDALINASKKQAQFGGIFSGPASGYPAPHRGDLTMHGREIVTPLRANSLLEMMATTDKDDSANLIQTLAGNNTTNIQMSNNRDLVMMLSEKLDQLLDKMSESVDIQDNLYKQSLA